jgi:hypothetical protein
MEEKYFITIYEGFYNKYLEQYIKEVEDSYKNFNKDGDAEIFAFNSCLTLLSNKTVDLKINSTPYDSIYSKFKDRDSLVQNNNLNRLYINHISPLCESLKIEMSNDIYENIIEEFAISDSSTKVYSWFNNWHPIYKMMFKLNDFSEFKLFRNCNYSEGLDFFKKYHKRLYPETYLKKEDKKRDFKIREEYKKCFENLWFPILGDYISEDLTSLEDFKNVFFKNWKSHDSRIYFSCSPEEASYFLHRLKFAFEQLSFASIHRSRLFYTREGNIFKEDHLSKQKNKIIDEEQQSINDLLNEVGLFVPD